MTPIYDIRIDGAPVPLDGRLVDLTLSDKNGFEADQLTLTIDDSEGLISLPKKGVTLTASFGFAGGLQNKGEYIVDEAGHSGPPDVVTVTAHAANFRDSLLEQREQSYDNKTLGDILTTIASRNKLKPAIAEKFKTIHIKHLDQTNESDANLLTRLAKDYDAVGTIKSNHLVFTERGSGKNAKGEDLPVATITRQMGDTHNYRESDRSERVTGVTAYWQDSNKGKRKKVEIGDKGYRKHLKRTYPTEAEATAAAEAELKRTKTRGKSLTLKLAYGRANLFAEQPLKALGYKKEIDAVKWFIKEVTHSLNDSGYTCDISAEVVVK